MYNKRCTDLDRNILSYIHFDNVKLIEVSCSCRFFHKLYRSYQTTESYCTKTQNPLKNVKSKTVKYAYRSTFRVPPMRRVKTSDCSTSLKSMLANNLVINTGKTTNEQAPLSR